MSDWPLLDLKSAWQDAERTLKEIQEMAETFYAESEDTWKEMLTIRQKVIRARRGLGTLPQSLLVGIAQDEADLAEMEDRADASSY